MTDGSYQSLDLGSLTAAFDHLGLNTSTFRPTVAAPTDIEDHVYQAAVGPTETSTRQTLVPMTDIPIWDVNGYYRALGIGWPYRPTRRQIGDAYRRVKEAMGGEANDYATYAFKQLLDRELRAKYDARRLGEPIDDLYRWLEVRKLAAEFARKQTLATGREVTVEDILGEDITSRMDAQAEAEKKAKEAQDKRDEVGPDGRTGDESTEAEFVWPYAYYLWSSQKFDDHTLAQWQEMVVRSCARQGLSLQVAVGYFGRTRKAAARVRHRKPEGGYVQILFLHEDAVPTQALADVVVATYYNYPQDFPLKDPLYLHGPL